ncbi:phosphopantetheine-binding protein [Streptomyces hawaiiensis]|uniref:phosphopantetheine-binding protein n=1 Tax=Streptomyces hawaiiensis TaxID=67305 RepID=UPI00364BD767
MSDLWPDTFESLLRAYLPLLPTESPLAEDASLAQLGLDSLGTVGMLVELEETFEVTIPDESLTPETFATPIVLWRTVDSLLTATGS